MNEPGGMDEPIPLSKVPQVVEEMYGRKISRQTVYQWIRDGRRYKRVSRRALQVDKMTNDKAALKTDVVMGRYYTTRRWIKDFAEATG